MANSPHANMVMRFGSGPIYPFGILIRAALLEGSGIIFFTRGKPNARQRLGKDSAIPGRPHRAPQTRAVNARHPQPVRITFIR